VSEPESLFTIQIPVPPKEVLPAIELASEDWGALWSAGRDGGDLRLPVTVGLRQGRLDGRVEVAAHGKGSEVRFLVEQSEYHLWIQAVVILAIGGFGGVMTVLWPFWPKLLQVAPFGAVLAFSAWMLVVARLENRSAQEFLEAVERVATAPEVEAELEFH